MEKVILNWINANMMLVESIEALIIVLLSWLIGKYLVSRVYDMVTKRLVNRHTLATLVHALIVPTRWLVYLAGMCLAAYTLHLPKNMMIIVGQIAGTVLAILIAVTFYSLMPTLFGAVNKVGTHLDVDIDELVSPFMTRILQAIIVVVDFFVVFAIWGINVGALFTGVGLAGLAVSMAAQDQIRNLLGGVVIITEKPFTIGDKIKSPSVLGVVEDITFRSTHLRTPDGDLQVVPNATLSNEPIKNLSRVDVPHITLQFVLANDTTKQQLDKLFDSILAFLREDDRFMAKHMEYRVQVDEFTERGISISVNGPLSEFGAQEVADTKNDLNIEILKLVELQELQFN
ncbi:mechanosensitive ion channel family protein [Weissella ceti]|uniref:Mechanosensitive ion channel family protein n=1 Tax=Weissella ceti TaxID=759620 RepID=A0ABT3E6V4_9LACO|nr:mechanosensitive ion channel family protein [Weissella ceti]MCW0953677.1 mechanosensitive ion channel family protein [Weissella ceti]QVK12243.1 mechanosensitive ion channel [Weissella ceti]